ncbi:MAG: hypothetical protein A2152_02865 [Candidatus Levybacteria bacterium RBG_16_35_6]|nr:MAG: hypothetical protein A2152_02865 [Candidatus Levybacteria bacterium RBG_16_35_6]
MKKKIHHHFAYYIVLSAILFLGFFAIQKTNDLKTRILILSIITFFYVLFGIIHHLLNHKFNVKIMIEYVLIGCLGISIVFFILKGGLGI